MRGDERQQIRWLAYLAGLAVVLLVGAIVSGWITGESAWDAAFFLALLQTWTQTVPGPTAFIRNVGERPSGTLDPAFGAGGTVVTDFAGLSNGTTSSVGSRNNNVIGANPLTGS